MGGRASRAKGQRGERAIAAVFRHWLPEIAGLINRGWQSRYGGQEEPDVTLPGFHVEVKTQKRPNIKAALEQAERDAAGDDMCVAITKADRQPWLVTMRLDTFMTLARPFVLRLVSPMPCPPIRCAATASAENRVQSTIGTGTEQTDCRASAKTVSEPTRHASTKTPDTETVYTS